MKFCRARSSVGALHLAGYWLTDDGKYVIGRPAGARGQADYWQIWSNENQIDVWLTHCGLGMTGERFATRKDAARALEALLASTGAASSAPDHQ